MIDDIKILDKNEKTKYIVSNSFKLATIKLKYGSWVLWSLNKEMFADQGKVRFIFEELDKLNKGDE